LQAIDEGALLFKGHDMTSLNKVDSKALKRSIQMVFQDPYASLNPRMKIEEILEEVLVIHDLGDKKNRLKKYAT